MTRIPLVMEAIKTIELAVSAVVLIEFIKEEAIQTAFFAAIREANYGSKGEAKRIYMKLRDEYILSLAKTVGTIEDFDPELVKWAGWTPWGAGAGVSWGVLSPYTKGAFVGFVDSSLRACKDALERL